MVTPRFDAWLDAPVNPAIAPRTGYLICTTPRSGSTYFCDLLRSTGQPGNPHEYFSAWMMQRLGRPHRYGSVEEHLALARSHGCTANGIYAVKIFRYNMTVLTPAAVMAAMGNPEIIFLERMDLLGQAISFTRSAVTRAFRAGETDAKEPVYDAALIRGYLELLIRDNAAWRLWFARQGITPLHVVYEELMADPQAVIDRLASDLGISEPVSIDPATLRVSVQRDALNAEWRARFLATEDRVPAFENIRSAGRVTFDRRLQKLANKLVLLSD
jgi:trehalose 2-sulfotransferase